MPSAQGTFLAAKQRGAWDGSSCVLHQLPALLPLWTAHLRLQRGWHAHVAHMAWRTWHAQKTQRARLLACTQGVV